MQERRLQRAIKKEEEKKAARELAEGGDSAAAQTTNYFDIAEGVKESGGKKKTNTKGSLTYDVRECFIIKEPLPPPLSLTLSHNLSLLYQLSYQHLSVVILQS